MFTGSVNELVASLGRVKSGFSYVKTVVGVQTQSIQDTGYYIF